MGERAIINIKTFADATTRPTASSARCCDLRGGRPRLTNGEFSRYHRQ